jgi:membrane protease YdiL (CAAX protease family)
MIFTSLVTYFMPDFLGKASYLLGELTLVLPMFIYLIWKKYPFKDSIRWNLISGKSAILSLIIGICIIVLFDEIDRLIDLIYPMPKEIQDLISRNLELKSWSDYLIVGSGVSVVAGITEEMLFRGFLQRPLEFHRGATRAVLTVSLVFALMHFNPWWLIQIILLAFLLGILTWRADSIIPATIVHTIFNGIALCSVNIELETLRFYSWKGHVSPLVIILALAILFLSLKAFFKATEYLHIE